MHLGHCPQQVVHRKRKANASFWMEGVEYSVVILFNNMILDDGYYVH